MVPRSRKAKNDGEGRSKAAGYGVRQGGRGRLPGAVPTEDWFVRNHVDCAFDLHVSEFLALSILESTESALALIIALQLKQVSQ